jgi:hypothetical protein
VPAFLDASTSQALGHRPAHNTGDLYADASWRCDPDHYVEPFAGSVVADDHAGRSCGLPVSRGDA